MPQKNLKLKDELWLRCVFFLITAIGLFCFAGSAAASNPDITSSSGWEIRGSASFTENGAVIGDTIGYDSRDQDNDGNYQNQGKAGSKIDYDFIISRTFFQPPVTMEWHGCLPVTRYGYNMFGLGKLYNGSILRQAVFQTRWEKQTAIQVMVNPGGSSYLTGISPSSGEFCADYKLDWDKDGIVTFYYNNKQVFKNTKKIKGPLVFFARTFEKPATISSLSITSVVGEAPIIDSISADTSSGQVPFETTVTCKASGSDPLLWSWDWDGDGTTDMTTQVDHSTHKYDAAGTYKAIVTVTDASGLQAQKSLEIVALAPDASSPQGILGGIFTGTITMANGTTKQVTGNVSGSWNAKGDSAGNIAASAKGTFGADGISGAFDVSYDSVSGQLNGSWGDIEGEILSQPISFVMEQGNGIRFRAPVRGLIPTSDGGMPFEGQVEIELLGLPEVSINGAVDGTFTADIAYKVSGSVSYPIMGQTRQIPVNLSGTVPTSGQVDGTWETSYASGTFTGKASGQFSGSIDTTVTTSVSTPLGPYSVNVPVKIPYSGIWQGPLSISGQTIAFKGNWLEPNIRAMGNADSSFGGAFGIELNNITDTWPLAITFTCPTSGGVYVDPDTGLQVKWTLQNFNGNGHLSN